MVDPLAESYQPFSPYKYLLNNPLANIDPDGRSVWAGQAERNTLGLSDKRQPDEVLFDWYKNLETGKAEYVEGSSYRQGYEYIGTTPKNVEIDEGVVRNEIGFSLTNTKVQRSNSGFNVGQTLNLAGKLNDGVSSISEISAIAIGKAFSDNTTVLSKSKVLSSLSNVGTGVMVTGTAIEMAKGLTGNQTKSETIKNISIGVAAYSIGVKFGGMVY